MKRTLLVVVVVALALSWWQQNQIQTLQRENRNLYLLVEDADHRADIQEKRLRALEAQQLDQATAQDEFNQRVMRIFLVQAKWAERVNLRITRTAIQ